MKYILNITLGMGMLWLSAGYAEAQQVGIEWCVQQCKELIAHGVPSLHFYSVGATDSIKEVAKQIY